MSPENICTAIAIDVGDDDRQARPGRGLGRIERLLAALEVMGHISESEPRHDASLRYAQTAVGMSRTPEERAWFEVAVALAIQRAEGHTEATDAVFERVQAEGVDPGLRASAFLAEAVNDNAERGWMLTQRAIDLLSDDSPLLWDECRTGFRVFDTAEDAGHYEVAIQFAQRALDRSRRYGWASADPDGGGPPLRSPSDRVRVLR